MAGSDASAHPARGHAHAHHAGAALEAAARGALEAAGEQWTALRAATFAILSDFDRPASAYDVADLLSRAQGRRIAANSVYRILDLFVATNLARRVECANAYLANPHPGCVHDCIFLVCDRCRQVVHLDDDAAAARVRQAAAEAGFVTGRPIIEVCGLCARCAANPPDGAG